MKMYAKQKFKRKMFTYFKMFVQKLCDFIDFCEPLGLVLSAGGLTTTHCAMLLMKTYGFVRQMPTRILRWC